MDALPAEDIDFVLVYETDHSGPSILRPFHGHTPASHSHHIHQFLKSVAKLGLELDTEVDDVYEATTKTYKQVHFVKIHATNAFLAESAELSRLRVPFKEVDVHDISRTSPASYLLRLVSREVKEEHRINRSYFYKVRFIRQLLPLYISEGWMLDVKGSLFSQIQRLELVWSALESLSFQTVGANGKRKSMTIRHLLGNSELSAAFPIHDSSLDASDDDNKAVRVRAILHESWASFKQWRVLQPLDDIYSYFGARVALYFAWLGFYTKALCLPAMLGIIATAYSVREYMNPVLDDYCNLEKAGHFTNCPLNEMGGDMTHISRLYESCTYMKLTAMFDNGFTIAYGLVICLWSTFFLEGWKRRQAELVWRWGSDSDGVDESLVRFQFINRYMKDDVANNRGANLKTMSEELDGDIHSATRLWSLSAITAPCYAFKIILSIMLFIFLVMFTVALAAASTFLRVFIHERLQRIVKAADYTDAEETLPNKVLDVVSPSLCATVIVSVLNAIVLLILGEFYTWIARRMANFECLRTEREYEKSFIYKITVFQFVNYFIGIFYTAFVKQWVTKQLQLREQCPSNGCVADVCIQILMVMSLKQLYGHAVELLSPMLKTESKRLIDNVMEKGRKKHEDDVTQNLTTTASWKNDYKLNDTQEPLLYSEYLKMCIQYAFVVLFATAFPPASVLALVNNVFAIRIDAKKCTQHFKRPIPIPARDIGPWFTVLKFITKAAVFTNAIIIAFGGSFIDRLVFQVYQYKEYNTSDVGNTSMSMLYMNHIYSQIPIENFAHHYFGAETHQHNITYISDYWTLKYGSPYCYTRDYVELVRANDEEGFYTWQETRTWWHVLAAKLVFVIVFEKVVSWLQTLIAGLIPDIPDHVRIQQEREVYLEQQTLVEANRADQGLKTAD